jgi:hypothetical protein
MSWIYHKTSACYATSVSGEVHYLNYHSVTFHSHKSSWGVRMGGRAAAVYVWQWVKIFLEYASEYHAYWYKLIAQNRYLVIL